MSDLYGGGHGINMYKVIHDLLEDRFERYAGYDYIDIRLTKEQARALYDSLHRNLMLAKHREKKDDQRD